MHFSAATFRAPGAIRHPPRRASGRRRCAPRPRPPPPAGAALAPLGGAIGTLAFSVHSFWPTEKSPSHGRSTSEVRAFCSRAGATNCETGHAVRNAAAAATVARPLALRTLSASE